MLPFLSMRLYRGNNLNLSKHIEKLKNNQLTIENVLEEDDIIQDLKLNSNSQFISILSNEAIRKLIDYATRMPSSDDQKIGHKFPFNAAEILCADNTAIQDRIMNEIIFKESEFYENEKDNKENKEDEKEEKNDEKGGEENKKEDGQNEENNIEEKVEAGDKKEEKEELGFVSGLNKALNKIKEEQKKEKENDKNSEKPKEEKAEEIKKEEKNEKEKNTEEKKEGEIKQEERKEEVQSEDKKEEVKKEEAKEEVKEEVKEEPKKEENEPEKINKEDKAEEQKKEEPTQKEEIINKETKNEETKTEEVKEEKKKEEIKTEEKEKIEEKEKTEEKKKEEINKEESKPEDKKPEDEKKEEKKPEEPEETKPEEQKVEGETVPEENQEVGETKSEEVQENKEEIKTDEVKPEEIKLEANEAEEPKKEVENEDEEDEEKGQHKHFPKEDEEDDNQKENEENENEDSEKEDDIKTVTIYDNIDHLFSFLKQSKETINNHVLVGYFYKILNHLMQSQSIKIVQYIFDYPKKKEFNILDALVVNLNRKSMGSIVNKLLLFADEGNELMEKKILLTKRILEELERCSEKDKYECICDVLASTISNKTFYIFFMSNPELVELLFSLLEKSNDNSKKLICIINLLIRVNENVLKNLSSHCTKNVAQENPLDFMSLFNYENNYPMDEKQINSEEMDEINKNALLSLFNTLKKTEFKFLEDLGVYNDKDNQEFLTTYQKKQRKIGMKKLAQIEFLRTILDIFVNSCNSQIHETEIEELIKILKNKNIFYYCHKLFFDFPFSNIYQTYYNQIIDIVVNQSSPESLIKYFFKYSDEKGEKNLVIDLMEHFFNNMKFGFNETNISFNPCFSYEITLLNKIRNSDNEIVKKLFIDDQNLKVFDEVIGEEINRIFNQKLLLADTLGANLGAEDEKPLPTFGKASFMQIIDEDTEIYKIYKEGGDYKTKLQEKIEREKAEKEKMEQEIVGEEEENKDEHIHPDDDEENEEGVEEIGVEREEEGEEGAAEEMEKEEQGKQKEKEEEEEDKKNLSTEESEEEKKFNDVNFWNLEIKPNDDILSSILNDIE